MSVGFLNCVLHVIYGRHMKSVRNVVMKKYVINFRCVEKWREYQNEQTIEQ